MGASSRNLLPLAAVFLLACLPDSTAAAEPSGSAEDFPARPVVIVVPSEGSSTLNTETRLFTQSVTARTGKAFVIENRGGAGSTIGTAYVAKARPDGYTLLSTNAAFVITPAIYADLPYDTVRDFAPVTLLDKHLYVLLVHPGAPYKTVGEYLAYARQHPDALNFSTTGAGGVTHLAGALLHYLSQTRVTFVHYKTPNQRLVDLMAGRVSASITAPLNAVPLMKAGKLRAIGVTSSQRIPMLPDVPTVAEQGVPGYEYGSWGGLVAPARTPPNAIARLNALFVQAVKDPEVIAKLEPDGTIMVGNTPEQFRQYIVTETERWRRLVRDTGIEIQPD